MEFTLNTVNIDYDRTEIVTPYMRRDTGLPRLRFVFRTETFVTMGLIAQLKKRPEFLNFLKQEIRREVQNLNDEDFDMVVRGINGCRAVTDPNPYYAKQNSILKLDYGNGTSRDDGHHFILFNDTLEGWVSEITTREDYVRAVLKMSQQSIRR